jgi:hypothetical protein
MNTYSNHRDKIQSGDILAWSHREWDTFYDFKIQMVRLATRSEYSHVAVAWRVAGRLFVIEAVEPMVRIYPLSKLGSFYHVPMQAPWLPSTEEAAVSFVGSEYKQLEAIRLFFEERKPGNVSECAALVLEVMARDGIYLGTRATPDAIMLEAQRLGNPTYLIVNGK